MRLCKLPFRHMCLMFFFSVSLFVFVFSFFSSSSFQPFLWVLWQFFCLISVLVWKFSVARRRKIFGLWNYFALVLTDSRLLRNSKETNFAYLLLLAKCTYYSKTSRHLSVRVGEQSSVSPLTGKNSNSKESIALKDHLHFCDHIVSIDDFQILATSDSDFHVKIKESILISCDEPILNKNETSLPL